MLRTRLAGLGAVMLLLPGWLAAQEASGAPAATRLSMRDGSIHVPVDPEWFWVRIAPGWNEPVKRAASPTDTTKKEERFRCRDDRRAERDTFTWVRASGDASTELTFKCDPGLDTVTVAGMRKLRESEVREIGRRWQVYLESDANPLTGAIDSRCDLPNAPCTGVTGDRVSVEALVAGLDSDSSRARVLDSLSRARTSLKERTESAVTDRSELKERLERFVAATSAKVTAASDREALFALIQALQDGEATPDAFADQATRVNRRAGLFNRWANPVPRDSVPGEAQDAAKAVIGQAAVFDAAVHSVIAAADSVRANQGRLAREAAELVKAIEAESRMSGVVHQERHYVIAESTTRDRFRLGVGFIYAWDVGHRSDAAKSHRDRIYPEVMLHIGRAFTADLGLTLQSVGTADESRNLFWRSSATIGVSYQFKCINPIRLGVGAQVLSRLRPSGERSLLLNPYASVSVYQFRL